MGNCCQTCTVYHKPQRNITLLVVGLDNAGKTTMAKRLAGESVNSVLKTLGFSLVVIRYRNYRISLYDLGGSAQIRDIWNKYFIDAHGIIYVVDSSDMDRLEESKRTFADLLAHENIAGKPVLLLANKQDKENTLDELEIVEQLDVERVVNRYRCLTRVEICSALSLEKYKIDVGMKSGFRWLVENVISNYQLLNERVQRDMTEFALRVERDRNEWRARMEAKNNADSCSDTPIENGNPFQPIDQENINERISPRISKIGNGVMVRNVLVDNYVREKSSSQVPDSTVETQSGIVPPTQVKTETGKIPDFTIKTDVQGSAIPIRKHVENTKRPYSKHKRKFARFNRTAPMPIDVLMQDSTNDSTRHREMSKYSTKSEYTFVVGNEFENRPRNYLTRRPATAPSKFNLSTVKVKTSWNLAAPLDVSATTSSRTLTPYSVRESSKMEDVISYL